MITRRSAIQKTAVAAAALATGATMVQPGNAAAQAAPTGPFTLPPLPYAFDALEPHIDARTMEIHHGKHHAAYVANLNKALADHPDLAKKTVEELVFDTAALPDKIRAAVRNNGGGHYNHSLFWQMMKKDGGGEPKGELAQAIDKKFGSFGALKDELTKAGLGQFGSGWAWLSYDTRTKELNVAATANQDGLVQYDRRFAQRYSLPEPGTLLPLLGVDVWEHAYYLKYQNRRADYIAAWFNVINWDYVAERYAKLKA